MGGTRKPLSYMDLAGLDNNAKRAIMMEQGDKKMRNGKKLYRPEGLVVDSIGGSGTKYRNVICKVGCDKYRAMCICTPHDYGLWGPWAVHMDDNDKVITGKISRAALVNWFRSAGFKVTRIFEPKKIRIVCS